MVVANLAGNERARALAVVVVCTVVLAALGSAVVASGASGKTPGRAARNCGSFKVKGTLVAKLRVTNTSCAQAKRALERYHDTAHGLRCLVSHDSFAHIRCTERVPTGLRTTRSRPRFVTAVLIYVLPGCAYCGL